MATLNKVMLIGRLGKNPEVRSFNDGSKVVNFPLATERFVQGGDKATDWHRIVAYGKIAEAIASYCFKGSLIYLEGRLQTREFTTDKGKQYVTEVVVFNLQFLDSRNSNQGQQQQNNQPAQKVNTDYKYQPKQATSADTFEEDEIPF